jgi:hypothetical protein
VGDFHNNDAVDETIADETRTLAELLCFEGRCMAAVVSVSIDLASRDAVSGFTLAAPAEMRTYLIDKFIEYLEEIRDGKKD